MTHLAAACNRSVVQVLQPGGFATFLLAAAFASASCGRTLDGPPTRGAVRSIVSVTGSDTMVNLVQAWAENYRSNRPDVSVEVAGGGSGVGIASLIDGIVDLAASSREMTADERTRARAHNGVDAREFSVALDALAVYVHAGNPLDFISLEQLADIYGDGGRLEVWSQLGVRPPRCRADRIVRIGRQSSSGTFTYFREVVLGRRREYKLGSIDQSGSKDVVALISRTPCAIGYSGMGYIIRGVKALKVSTERNRTAIGPSADAVVEGSYPIARRLYFYARDEPSSETKRFLDWVRAGEGQRIVRDLGFVPIDASQSDP
jgi:phosphate transport system substrate-binding protein